MLRSAFALIVVTLALAYPLGSGAMVDRPGAVARVSAPGTITIKARTGEGAWRSALSLKLVKTKLTPFAVCALWNQPAATDWGPHCAASGGAKLPAGTTLRLEQSPIGKAMARADSPGWGMVAISDKPSLEAVLSNTLSGNKYGTLRYRVTLRDEAGKVLATSNATRVVWHH